MATYDGNSLTTTKGLRAGDIINFAYKGSKQAITLIKGIYMLEVWGAQGGYRSTSTYAGYGGYAKGTLTLVADTQAYVYSGGSGGNSTSSTASVNAGGFNGGGKRYGYKGGGGASDIRLVQDSLYARVIVAGGGGSDGAAAKHGMYGGGTTGGSSSESYGTGGYGGTQTGNTWLTATQSSAATSNSDAYAGFGFGGNGVHASSGYGGAGGGGWYGGSGSYPDGSGDDDRGGGGGSGFVWTGSNAPSGYLLDSTYYLTNTSLIGGNSSFTSPTGSSETGHTGNGYARITIVEIAGGAEVYVKQEIGTGYYFGSSSNGLGYCYNPDNNIITDSGVPVANARYASASKYRICSGTDAGLYESENGKDWDLAKERTDKTNITRVIGHINYLNNADTFIAGTNATKNNQLYINTGDIYWDMEFIDGAVRCSDCDNDNIYVGTDEGIYSIDYQITGTLTKASLSSLENIKTICRTSHGVIAGSSGGAGLFYSEDGTTWNKSNQTTLSIEKVCSSVESGATIQTAVAVSGMSEGFWYSIDSGKTWTVSNVTNMAGFDIEIIYTSSTTYKYFVAGWDGLYESTDGQNWSINTALPSNVYNQVKYVNGILFVLAANDDVYYSYDYGETFNHLTDSGKTYLSLAYFQGDKKWLKADTLSLKTNSQWKEGEIFVKVNDEWKQ